jgi:hypothetical protein|tara:strand:+ start:422 stop:664 length:243 start_codon:yes stop_codon:yes gene_type:complete
MNRISTQLDIIRYIYKELEEKEKQHLKVKSLIDLETKSVLDFFVDVKCELDDVMLTPSDAVIKNIKKISSSLKIANKNYV